jgi:hypothetical protein
LRSCLEFNSKQFFLVRPAWAIIYRVKVHGHRCTTGCIGAYFEGIPVVGNIFKVICIDEFTLLRVHNLKKFDNTGEDLEDLISIGTIGLIKAIESFSPNKGTKLKMCPCMIPSERTKRGMKLH